MAHLWSKDCDENQLLSENTFLCHSIAAHRTMRQKSFTDTTNSRHETGESVQVVTSVMYTNQRDSAVISTYHKSVILIEQKIQCPVMYSVHSVSPASHSIIYFHHHTSPSAEVRVARHCDSYWRSLWRCFSFACEPNSAQQLPLYCLTTSRSAFEHIRTSPTSFTDSIKSLLAACPKRTGVNLSKAAKLSLSAPSTLSSRNRTMSRTPSAVLHPQLGLCTHTHSRIH